jgi:hypothetical protein
LVTGHSLTDQLPCRVDNISTANHNISRATTKPSPETGGVLTGRKPGSASTVLLSSSKVHSQAKAWQASSPRTAAVTGSHWAEALHSSRAHSLQGVHFAAGNRAKTYLGAAGATERHHTTTLHTLNLCLCSTAGMLTCAAAYSNQSQLSNPDSLVPQGVRALPARGSGIVSELPCPDHVGLVHLGRVTETSSRSTEPQTALSRNAPPLLSPDWMLDQGLLHHRVRIPGSTAHAQAHLPALCSEP